MYRDYLRSTSKGICNPTTNTFRANAVLSGRCLGSPHMATWQIAQSGLMGVFGSNPHLTASLRSLTSRSRMKSNSPGSGSPAHPGSRRALFAWATFLSSAWVSHQRSKFVPDASYLTSLT